MPRAFRLVPDNPKEVDRQAEIIRYLIAEPKVKFIIRVNGGGRFSKYPPAKPGALDCEPLKAAN
jgi:hypothetical protein